jgi:hypothetical protein
MIDHGRQWTMPFACRKRVSVIIPAQRGTPGRKMAIKLAFNGMSSSFSGFEHVLTVDDYLEFRLDRVTIENPGMELKHVCCWIISSGAMLPNVWGDYLYRFSLQSPLPSHQKWWVWQDVTTQK